MKPISRTSAAANAYWRHGSGCFPRLELIWADSGYKKEGFDEWVKAELGWEVEIIEHPWSGLRGVWVPQGVEVDWEKIRPKGFHVLKRRWVVENTQSQYP